MSFLSNSKIFFKAFSSFYYLINLISSFWSCKGTSPAIASGKSCTIAIFMHFSIFTF